MQHFSINFFSLKELNGVCDIGYAQNNGDIILEFISIFDFSITGQRCISLPSEQQYSKEMEERLSLFIEKYKTVHFFTKRTTIQQRDGREIKLIYRKI